MRAGSGISGAETTFLTAGATFATGVFVLPRLLVADAGRAGILALLLVALAAILWTSWIAGRSQRLPARSLPLALVRQGGAGGRAWLVLLALFELLLAGEVSAQFATMAVAVILPGASRFGVSTLILLSAFTAARHRVEGLARTVYVSFLFAGMLAFAAFALLLGRADQLAAVLPGPHLSVGPILAGSIDSIGLYAGATTIVAFLPAQRYSRQMPAVIGGVILVTVLIVVAYVAAIGTGGPGYVLTQIWPVVTALRTLVLRSFVLNRIGLVVVLAWSAFVLTFSATHLWAAAEYACIAMDSQRSRPLVALAGTVLAGVFATFSGPEAQTEVIVRHVVGPAVAVVLLSWILLAYLLTRRRPQASGG